MNNLNSDQLIEPIKNEVTAKAHQEANMIKALKEAEDIIKQAKIKALDMLNEAQREINDERNLFNQEMKLAARDFCLQLSERLRQQMILPIIKAKVRVTLKEPLFLQEVLTKLCVDCVKENVNNIDVLLSRELKITLSSFIQSAIFDHLEKNPSIRLKDEEGLEGFLLIKRDDNYVWDFRLDTVAKEIMRLIEPHLRKYFIIDFNAIEGK